MTESRPVVIASLIGDLAVAVIKFAAAAMTGSAALIGEGFHSVVDAGNGALLLYGFRRARAGRDADHPLGHGRELYFWSFVVSLLLLLSGAVATLVEGILRFAKASPIEDIRIAYFVLLASFVPEGFALRAAWRSFHAEQGDLGFWEAIRESKDPPVFMTLIEGVAGVLGLILALSGAFLSSHYEDSRWDAFATVLIGVMLGALALLLVRETKGLLIGESADAGLQRSISSLAAEQPGVDGVNGAFATHLAPDQIIVAMSLEFQDSLTAPEIERVVENLEGKIRERHNKVYELFVKPQTRKTYEVDERRP
jgi:cation diffusion facilitator family transporter